MIRFAGISALAVALTGCATMTQQGTTRTPAPPPGPVQASSPAPGVIPAGTTMVVRTNEAISSKEAGSQTYTGQIDREVVDQGGRVLIPRGSPVELAVMQSSGGGAVGTRNVELGLRAITVNGQRMMVTSEGETAQGREGLGANKRTAAMVGGGALLGTLIGAVAGGGAGAAVGAAVGAAGGAATQVLTRGDEVRVPAESVLTFRLDSPLNLRQ